MDEKKDFHSKARNLNEKKRRDQFNMLICELGDMVASGNKKMDKTTVLKCAISFLQNHQDVYKNQHNTDASESWKPLFVSDEEYMHLMLDAFNGFIMVFSSTGKILYVSDGMHSLLGYFPSDPCTSVFDMVHIRDQSTIQQLINAISGGETRSTGNNLSCNVFMKRGPLSSVMDSYEPVHLTGTYYSSSANTEGLNESNFDNGSKNSDSMCSPTPANHPQLIFITLVKLRIPQFSRAITLPTEISDMGFVSRQSMEWKFLFLDHRATSIIGYLPSEVLGTSGYNYYHHDDLEEVVSGHEMLMQTGAGTSNFYRFLTKGQQWIWLQTHYFISYHQWNSKPEFVVCKNVVVNTDLEKTKIQNKMRQTEVCSKPNDASVRMFSDLNIHPEKSNNEVNFQESTSVGKPIKEITAQGPSSNCSMQLPPYTRNSQTDQGPQSITTFSPSIRSHNYLHKKHLLLQQQIFRQQQELKRVSDQLRLAQFATHQQQPNYETTNSCRIYQPVIPVVNCAMSYMPQQLMYQVYNGMTVADLQQLPASNTYQYSQVIHASSQSVPPNSCYHR